MHVSPNRARQSMMARGHDQAMKAAAAVQYGDREAQPEGSRRLSGDAAIASVEEPGRPLTCVRGNDLKLSPKVSAKASLGRFQSGKRTP